ncbi:DUF167 domain-containing protein [Patescibacteria group bacterium]|nr:DUF167 domain-containing protein [Patescibacteria group bacterium]
MDKIFVFVKTGAKTDKIEQVDENHFIIQTKEPAKEDKANKAVAKILAEFLGLPPSQISLIKGGHFKEKVFEIQ